MRWPLKKSLGGKSILTITLALAAMVALPERGGAAAQREVLGQLHPAPPDYVYRTGQAMPDGPERETIWDYLSFLALPQEKKDRPDFPVEEATELKMRVRELCRQILENAPEGVADEYAVLVSSFVNLNHLYLTSSLGRYIGEQMIGELQGAGVEVADVRKASNLMIREGYGEYAMSRDMNELSYVHAAHATLVGTYTRAGGQLLINARLLRNSDGVVLSHANLVLRLDPVTEALLADESMPPRAGTLVSVRAFPEKGSPASTSGKGAEEGK